MQYVCRHLLSHAGSIYTFNTGVEAECRDEAASVGVAIIANNIIYRLVEQLRHQVGKLMPMLQQEEVLGKSYVLTNGNCRIFASQNK